MMGQKPWLPINFGLIALIALLFGFVLAFVLGYLSLGTVDVPVPIDRLPAYHILQANDFAEKSLDNRILAPKTIRNVSSYVNGTKFYCTLESLAADEPIMESNLIEVPNLTGLDNPIVVGVPTASSAALGGSLHQGDMIDLVIPGSGGNKLQKIEDVQILDIKRNASNNGSGEFTIIVILERDDALSLINSSSHAQAYAIRDIWR
jgi:hypothetical protein